MPRRHLGIRRTTGHLARSRTCGLHEPGFKRIWGRASNFMVRRARPDNSLHRLQGGISMQLRLSAVTLMANVALLIYTMPARAVGWTLTEVDTSPYTGAENAIY